MPGHADAFISFSIRSPKIGNIVVPPDNTIFQGENNSFISL